ncbi:thioesterase II family protein [Nonomuraea sp. MG754425]|uniref:thioesterase II family protein n=1 Tax=Nonomuraea sp. MG754425 TaxID=2570319 RepID=UPI001F021A55|nr:thioesterase domain-containing protein [Nonomuraea sp. MG754425]
MELGSRDWFFPLVAHKAPVRVFSFPQAGAGCAKLVDFAKAAAPDVTVWGANLPGRQARLEEEAPRNLDTLIDTMADEIVALIEGRYALFGYCGGALLAFLVARALRQRGTEPPASLIVASFEAPDIGRRPPDVCNLPASRMWARLVEEEVVPAETAVDERLRRISESALRADLLLLTRYEHRPAPPLPCPVTVCFGKDDPTPRGAWLGWRRQSARPVRLHPVTGRHFLLDEAGAELAAAVVAAVADADG